MVINRNKMFTEILNNFIDKFTDVEAVVVSDVEGLIIAGEKRKDIQSSLEIVSVLTILINPVLERIRNEFAFKKFGTGSFDTDEYRLLFISIDEERILSIIFNAMASVEKVSPYAYFLAEKCAQIINAKEQDLIQLSIPDFEQELDRHEKLKHSIFQSNKEEYGTYAFKFIIVGDHEVGKTSIVRRFVEKKFSADYRATIGLNILAHNFNFEGNDINVQLWDIGAQQYFKRFRKMYYSGAEAAFVVFDLTQPSSFININNWFQEISNLLDEKDIPIIIIGNKSDLSNERQISTEKGQKLASSLSEEGLSYLETSALTGENVHEAFELIAYHYIMKSKQKEREILKDELYRAINLTLKELVILELTFINETLSWNPGFQTIFDIEKLGDYSEIKNNSQEKLFTYKNGLILSCFTYKNFNLSNSDGVFCVFDAREKKHIAPNWKDFLIEVTQKIRKKRVIVVAIRVDDDSNWSRFMEELNIEENLEEKLVTILFLKIGPDFRTKIYENLKVMLDAIVNTRKLK
ncbi:MAG: GTP-binding protein [Candidatus Lokiarchaeota archaeon]|nr:GTP-binding protein [Candidatus Lokiarchaeota archaeon]